MFRRGLGSVLLATVLAGTSALAADKISAEQYIEQVKGNTIFGVTDDGARWKAFYKDGGRIVINLESGFYDEGKWEVAGDKLCLQWAKVRKGDRYCLRDFEKDGDRYSAFDEFTGKRGKFSQVANGTAEGYRSVSQ